MRLTRGTDAARTATIAMHDVAAIEAINHDQVVTRTDRLLLRARLQTPLVGGPPSRRSFDFTREAQAALERSRARTAASEPTVHIRMPAASPLLAAAVFAMTWLATTLVCLLV